MTETLSAENLTLRFDEIGRRRLDELQEQYGRMSLLPVKPGDLETQRRHGMFRALLTHIALLQKMLGTDVAARRQAKTEVKAGPKTYDTAELQAMLDEVREARDD